MKKSLPIILWILVIVVGGFTFYVEWTRPKRPVVMESETDAQSTGAVLVDVPWKHLQHVPDFEMTNQDGQPFCYRDFAGQPMVVSFFFAGCPSICRDLNSQIKRLRDQLKDQDILFFEHYG